jgi:hypothetical protein
MHQVQGICIGKTPPVDELASGCEAACLSSSPARTSMQLYGNEVASSKVRETCDTHWKG